MYSSAGFAHQYLITRLVGVSMVGCAEFAIDFCSFRADSVICKAGAVSSLGWLVQALSAYQIVCVV